MPRLAQTGVPVRKLRRSVIDPILVSMR